jgi:hypothetical protein
MTYEDARIIRYCIRQVGECVRPFEFHKLIGVGYDYIRAIQCYSRAVAENRPNEPTAMPITFNVNKINDDRFDATMTLDDLRAIGNCIKLTLERTEHWEIHTLIGAYVNELEELLNQILEIQRQAVADHTT